MLEVQTRDEQGHCATHNTVQAAFTAASEDPEIWKISWTVQETRERVRFVRRDNAQGTSWIYDPMELPKEISRKLLANPPTQLTIIP